MAEEERVKYLWATHASKRTEVDSNRETASTVGRVERAKPRPARDSPGRRRYLGAWRLWSVFTTQSKGQLARSPRRDRQQSGRAAQRLLTGRPGMPVRLKAGAVDPVLLEGDISPTDGPRVWK